MNIRLALESEAPLLSALAMRAKAHWGYSAATLERWRSELAVTPAGVSERPTFIAMVGHEVAGFYSLRPSQPSWELDNLWVLPEFMHQGIGRALLAHALETAARGGASEVTVDADPNAESFYLENGAVRRGEVAAPIDGQPERVRPQLAFVTLQSLEQSWTALPVGARAAIEQQWAGLAARALPCGSAVVDANDRLVAVGRNHAYDPAGRIETRLQHPLQHNRLAHAELNALACIPTETDHAGLVLWTTQHPCLMCAAALRFVGIGKVGFIADDPSDHAPQEAILATRGRTPYERLESPLWWTICNVFFLYNSAVQRGEDARNLKLNRSRYPELVSLTLALARDDVLGHSARSGAQVVPALMPHYSALARAAQAPERK